jgi:hypothetical protein
VNIDFSPFSSKFTSRGALRVVVNYATWITSSKEHPDGPFRTLSLHCPLRYQDLAHAVCD